MPRNNVTTPSSAAIHIVVIYVIVGCIWILFSDRLLEIMATDRLQSARIAMLKGWAFVGLTATLLYLLIHRSVARQQATEQALRVAEGSFRNMLETVHLAAVMLDRDCRISFCNDFLLELTGWTQAEILGKSWFEVFIPAEERIRVLAANESVKADNVVPHFENHILTKSGAQRLIVWNNTMLRDPDGGVIGTASIGVDVTEHRRLEEEQRRMDQQILHAQKLESMGIMAGGIAHDFNNILTAVMGNAELALLRHKSREPVDEFLERILASAGQAAELARQMLAYSGKCVFTAMPHDLGCLVAEMRHLLEISISSNVRLKLHTGDPLPVIAADAAQLRQVITSLVINASEAIGTGSGAIDVTTGSMDCDQNCLNDCLPPNFAFPSGRYVYLEVTDTGCGMERETITRIFDPFFTTKFIGRGLGMAATLGIVRGHSGCIKVASVPGEGTTFRILFPVSTINTESAQAAAAVQERKT